ncbi:hypothetical protein L3X38_036644 [Prunus dulcis]|uniref:Uncharacterized protein n=1 Tax=Prunus dulcis TaxID=3755 RepID=A0AAD4V3X6_PRUDU|nr:hypothetical protein L3X38_036644 [Prunus dulcis]
MVLLHVEKSSPTKDAYMSDLLKTNLLSSPSTCFKRVYLETVSSISLEKQREAIFHLLKKGVVLVAETIRNSFVVAPSSTADLVSQKYAYFLLDHKNLTSTMNAYNLGYLHYLNGNYPFYANGDGDIGKLCSDFLPMQSE